MSVGLERRAAFVGARHDGWRRTFVCGVHQDKELLEEAHDIGGKGDLEEQNACRSGRREGVKGPAVVPLSPASLRELLSQLRALRLQVERVAAAAAAGAVLGGSCA